jgi:hypothetical protein
MLNKYGKALPLKDMRKLLYSRCNVLYYLKNVESVWCVCATKILKQKKDLEKHQFQSLSAFFDFWIIHNNTENETSSSCQ